MNKNRITAILLFSSAAIIVWFTFLFIMADDFQEIGKVFTVGGAIASISATVITAYYISPKIYLNSLKPFDAIVYGVAITFLSYLLGSILFGIGSTIFEIIVETNYVLGTRSIQGAMLTIIVGFLYCVIYMSLGFILGGLIGYIYYRIIKTNPAT